MIFEQFYLGCLAHASYLIGSEGKAAVIDPQRDIEIYVDIARQHGLTIAYIIESHLHADFVSGHGELAARTGATICLGEGSGATFPHQPVRDGEEISFGKCRLKFLQTPGHTFESISIVVTDLEQGPGPYAVLTGDTLFIGDVGRPDLSDTYTPQELAGFLYDSINQKLLTLPDDVLVYPAHGAGSMCGRNISTDRTSTIGRERKSNYALQPMTRTQFISLMTEDLPPRPEYFERDVEINRHGAAALTELPELPALAADEALRRQEGGAQFLDLRSGAAFCGGHIPGSVNIGLSGQFASWAGSVIGLDRDLILMAEDRKSAEEARQRLARVGIERVIGFLDEGISGWVRAGLPLQQIEEISPQDAAEQFTAGNMYALDVRRKSEWAGGHITGAVLMPLDDLRKKFATLDQDRAVVVHCKGGYRSTIACSLLQANGFTRVANLRGGFDAWAGAGLATTA